MIYQRRPSGNDMPEIMNEINKYSWGKLLLQWVGFYLATAFMFAYNAHVATFTDFFKQADGIMFQSLCLTILAAGFNIQNPKRPE